MDIVSLMVGLVIGVIATALYTKFMVDQHDPTPQNGKGNKLNTTLVALLVFGGIMLMSASPSLAQTPVPIVIPTNVIFTETNTWINTFAPIAAIGIGITVALSVLGYLGKMIAGAFKT